MTAAYHEAFLQHSGLRQADPHRDMGQIAALIELVFADTLDRSGRRMVRDMRRMGDLGWLGWAVSFLWLPSVARLTGFVWEEEGRVVGNLGLSPVEGSPGRWVMANIAVHPDFRRRGIGKALVDAGLEKARQSGAETVLLQVDSENKSAQVLYAAEGFRPLTTRSTWRRSPESSYPLGTDSGTIRRRRTGEWRAQIKLAQLIHPEGLIWPHPTQATLFQPTLIGEILGWDRDAHWVWEENGSVLASLSVKQGSHPRSYRLILLVRPERRGEMEAVLLGRALQEMPLNLVSFVCDYPAGQSESAFEGYGFRKERTLTWMQIRLNEKAQVMQSPSDLKDQDI